MSLKDVALSLCQWVPPSDEVQALKEESLVPKELEPLFITLHGWNKRAKRLSGMQRGYFCQQLSPVVARVFEDIEIMRREGKSEAIIEGRISQAVDMVNATALAMKAIGLDRLREDTQTELELCSTDRCVQELTIPHRQAHHREELGSFFTDFASGAAAHEVEHLLGEPWGMAFEVAAGAMAHEASKESRNEVRDRLISSSAHVGLLEGMGVVLGESLPAYQALVGAHVVGKAAHAVADLAEDFLEKHTPEEYEEPKKGFRDSEPGLTPYQSGIAVKILADACKGPSHVLHVAHESIAKAGRIVMDSFSSSQIDEFLSRHTADEFEMPNTLLAEPNLNPYEAALLLKKAQELFHAH